MTLYSLGADGAGLSSKQTISIHVDAGVDDEDDVAEAGPAADDDKEGPSVEEDDDFKCAAEEEADINVDEDGAEAPEELFKAVDASSAIKP